MVALYDGLVIATAVGALLACSERERIRRSF